MKNPSIALDDKVSEGQIQTCATLVADAARKVTGTTLRELTKKGILNRRNIERVRARGNEVVVAINILVKEKFAEIAENITGIVKLISGAETLEIDETDGKATIAEAENTFPGYIDSDFKDYGCDVKSEPTKKTQVTVHEMIKNGTFGQIFNGMGDDLNKLAMTQPQIIQFVQKHRKWLCTEGYGTLFLFKVRFNEGAKEECEEFFVAHVRFGDDGRLKVYVHRFSFGNVWYAEDRHRIVVPQLTLGS